MRHYASTAYHTTNGDTSDCDTTSLWRQDTSRLAAAPRN
ncbi:hypothetical protein ABT116_38505 [Streptomyces sp. NPDC002130]